ncbi:MAG: antibiotic biosynthesis monooxygenase family protein [Deferrisomatales bacterium]
MVWVLIERRVAEGMVESFQDALHRARVGSREMPGYLSGETLQETGDRHHFVVISTWASRDDWEAWAASETRRRELVRLAPMLEEPERITVLQPT